MSAPPAAQAAPNVSAWRSSVLRRIFEVTLSPSEAESSAYRLAYLGELAQELKDEGQSTPMLDPSLADRVLIARLSLDPMADGMTEDPAMLATLAGLDENETSWDWLVASWKRCQKEVGKARKGLGAFANEAVVMLQEVSGLIISYAGLVLMTPDMFPRSTKNGQQLSPLVLVPSLLNLGGYSSSGPESSTAASWATFDQHEIVTFLAELAKRFHGDGLEDILGPPVGEITRRIRDGVLDDPAASSSSANPMASATAPNDNQAALQAAAQAGDVRAVLAHLLGQGGGGAQAAGNAAARGTPASAANGLFGTAPSKNGMHLGGFEWRSHVSPLIDMSDNKQIASAFADLPNFNPENVQAPRLELDSTFGPMLRLSVFGDTAPVLLQQEFSNPSSRSKGDLESTMRSLRQTQEVVHQQHHRFFHSLVTSSPASRKKVLQFWATVANVNHRRGAMQVDRRHVSTDGFTVNIWDTLERFAEPFMDVGYTKIDKIDVEYLRRQKRFDVSALTRLNASEPEAQKWADEAPPAAQAPNFISEVFFLAVRMTNLGPGKAIRAYHEREENGRRYAKRVKEFESTRNTWASTPQAAEYEAFIKRGQAQIELLKAENYAAATQLLDPGFIQRMLHLTSFTMTWLVRIADPKRQHPKAQVQLPLPHEVPEVFRMLPEHIFEDVCDILLFLARRVPMSLPDAVKVDFVTFTTTFLSSGWFIKNPFLKAKLAEIMYWNVSPIGYSQTGVLGDVVNFHPLALQHLVPALMSFWVEAESTGSHTQFYDKFNIRFHLSQIFKVLWTSPDHMKKIHAESTGNSTNFVIFVNRLMNDVTYLLDDALEKLQTLHARQQEMDDTSTWNERPANERQEIESHVQSTSGQIRSILQFGHEFLRLLIDFTAQTKDAFMTPEIVSRLAAMLDFNLDLMVGPRCTELKVKDPQSVGFEPRTLLRQILSVYLNLCERREFISAIAQDGRSYRKATFEKACSISSRHGLKTPMEIEAIATMVGKVELVIAEELQEEEDLGEVPDEYSDPLMATLMKDPVKLPTSGAIVDRSTIKSHLLSDATDPFNRAPLKLEDVVDAKELREEIEQWIRQRKEAKGKA